MHTTSREMSQALKDSGWTKRTAFVWNMKDLVYRTPAYDELKCTWQTPAALLTEILLELPEYTHVHKVYDGYLVRIELLEYFTRNTNPCDAAAKLWIKMQKHEVKI